MLCCIYKNTVEVNFEKNVKWRFMSHIYFVEKDLDIFAYYLKNVYNNIPVCFSLQIITKI